MGDKVKSVFRQKIYEKMYKVICDNLVIGKFHSINYIYNIIDYKGELLEDKLLETGMLDYSYLKVGDIFYLKSIEKEVQIESIIRNSDGSVALYIEDETEETNVTKITEEYAKQIVKEREKYIELDDQKNEKYNKLKKEYTKFKDDYIRLKLDFEDYRIFYKYGRRFFNFHKADNYKLKGLM